MGAISEPGYVAGLAEGSRHSRGCTVELTLSNGNGKELLMPPDFDDFSERDGHGYEDLPEEAIRNRDLLREVMEGHGFVALRNGVVAL